MVLIYLSSLSRFLHSLSVALFLTISSSGLISHFSSWSDSLHLDSDNLLVLWASYGDARQTASNLHLSQTHFTSYRNVIVFG
jgi:hypothetical protein